MTPANTRRCPRHQVNLPVRIAPGDETSQIAAPGLAIEISQSGMALYGGIELQPGDFMEVEFQTTSHLRVAGVVRNRTGYCFGLEFLAPQTKAAQGVATSQIENSAPSRATASSRVYTEDELLELFLQRHAAYLHQKDLEIKRLREQMLKARQMHLELDILRGRPGRR
jgi:PilZ domain